jgi:hypothetical protein
MCSSLLACYPTGGCCWEGTEVDETQALFPVKWLLLGRDGCRRTAFCVFLCLSGLAAKLVDVVESRTFFLSGDPCCGSSLLKIVFFFVGWRCWESNGLKNETCFCMVAVVAEVMDWEIKRVFCVVALALEIKDWIIKRVFLYRGARCGSNRLRNQTFFMVALALEIMDWEIKCVLYGGARSGNNELRNQTCFIWWRSLWK